MADSLPVFDLSDDPRLSRTWAEVDLAAVAANIRALERRVGDAGAIMAVLKADGYGHGAIPMARACAAQGVTHIGVASVAEALELRGAGISGEIYLLSAFLPEEAEAIVRADLTPFLSSPEQAEALIHAAESASPAAALPARAFLTVDTGMGREGCLPEVARSLWKETARHPALRFSGIATHFSSADEDDWENPTAAQLANFAAFLDSLGPEALQRANDGRSENGIWLSLCNSPGTLRLPPFALPSGARGILFRSGLSLYGIAPYRAAQEEKTEFRPVLSWRARITLVRDLPAGATIGYGRTHTLTSPARIATVAVGYADGLPRRLSNTGYVLLQNRRFPLVGRVSMDQCQIDVTDAPLPIRPGGIVTLIGSDGPEIQSAFDLADQCGMTPHEPTCALTNRVPRVYSEG